MVNQVFDPKRELWKERPGLQAQALKSQPLVSWVRAAETKVPLAGVVLGGLVDNHPHWLQVLPPTGGEGSEISIISFSASGPNSPHQGGQGSPTPEALESNT